MKKLLVGRVPLEVFSRNIWELFEVLEDRSCPGGFSCNVGVCLGQSRLRILSELSS
jgi:hypothetical protein